MPDKTTLTVFRPGLVTTAGTKYRVVVRQTQGSASLTTVALQSALEAKFFPRSVYLAADLRVFSALDAWLDTGAFREGFDFLQFFSLGGGPAHPIFQFDVTALTGLLYKSVKLVLTYESELTQANPTPGQPIRLARILRPWDLVSDDVNDTHYDFSAGGAGLWETIRAGGTLDHDFTTRFSWSDYPTGPKSIGEIVRSPDMTTLVDDAIAKDSGIFKLIMRADGSGGLSNRFHSRTASVAVNSRPHLFFEAFK